MIPFGLGLHLCEILSRAELRKHFLRYLMVDIVNGILYLSQELFLGCLHFLLPSIWFVCLERSLVEKYGSLNDREAEFVR